MNEKQFEALFDQCWAKTFDNKTKAHFEAMVKDVDDKIGVSNALAMNLYFDLRNDLYYFLHALLSSMLFSCKE